MLLPHFTEQGLERSGELLLIRRLYPARHRSSRTRLVSCELPPPKKRRFGATATT